MLCWRVAKSDNGEGCGWRPLDGPGFTLDVYLAGNFPNHGSLWRKTVYARCLAGEAVRLNGESPGLYSDTTHKWWVIVEVKDTSQDAES